MEFQSEHVEIFEVSSSENCHITSELEHIPLTEQFKMEYESELVDIFEISSNGSSNVATEMEHVPLTQQLNQIDMLSHQDQSSFAVPLEGIEANDVGSLLEQFLEYEQGSSEVNSYTNSSFMTPCGSPGEQNDDAVLGRLMIVQEKLTREVEDGVNDTKEGGEEEEEEEGEENNNLSSLTDGLLRTVNGIHPKGDNIRMADSPKFARFKKKKLTSDPPLRRCFSGPTTPRCTSPSDIVSQEEMKRREAKLIEALAITVPKPQCSEKNIVDKAKRSLSTVAGVKRKKVVKEPLASRMMPVISKRQKKQQNTDTKTIDPKLVENTVLSVDPRLNRTNYGEKSNVTHLADTNLVEIISSQKIITESHDDLSVVDMAIDRVVDMTIDHDTLAGNIVSVQHTTQNKNAQANMKLNESNESSPTDGSNSFVLNETDSSLTDTQFPVKKEGVVKPPKNYRQMNKLDDSMTELKHETKRKTSRERSKEHSKELSPLRKRSPRGYSRRSRSPPRSPSPPRYHSRSPSIRPYSPYHPRSRSLSRDRTKSHSRARSMSHSRSRSRSVTRSPCRASSRRNSTSSSKDSVIDNQDINSKLSELSNPVPYDIEHERKVRFLCGAASRGKTERRNIYAGGITRNTSKAELAERFKRFGRIEKITLHFRDKGDNYAFVVFDEPENAIRAIEEGNDDPVYPRLELCYGGRRKFVGGSYVDFDGNNEYLEEKELASRNAHGESPEDDFDKLLQMALRDKKKREPTPEWT